MCITNQPTNHNSTWKICPKFQVLSFHFSEVNELLNGHWEKIVIRENISNPIHVQRWRFAEALLPRLFGKNPRSHHKGANGRVRTGDQRLPVLCHCRLGQDIPRCNPNWPWIASGPGTWKSKSLPSESYGLLGRARARHGRAIVLSQFISGISGYPGCPGGPGLQVDSTSKASTTSFEVNDFCVFVSLVERCLWFL